MNQSLELRKSKPMESLRNLIDTVTFVHHQVIRQKLAALNRVIQRIAQNHVVPLTDMDPFERQFLAMADQLECNLEEQECWLFGWLRRLMKRGLVMDQDNYLGESLEEAMVTACTANQEALVAIDQLQTCLCHPDWMDKGLLVEELIDHLGELEEQLTEYDHLEREELFPWIRNICKSWAKEEEINNAN